MHTLWYAEKSRIWWRVWYDDGSKNGRTVAKDLSEEHAKRIAAMQRACTGLSTADLEAGLLRDVMESRRIVACVNACTGISTDDLEAGCLLDAIAALEMIFNNGAAWAELTLKEQRIFEAVFTKVEPLLGGSHG